MNDEKIWTEEEKEEWLAAHGGTATHVVTFEPMYQIEVCVPPWEHPDRHIARSAVAWGRNMGRVFERRAVRAAPPSSPPTTRGTRSRSTGPPHAAPPAPGPLT